MITPGKFLLTPNQYVEAYRKILLLRRFEEKCGQLYGMGEIGGFCHLYIGQEAVITAIDMVRQKSDSMITSYRDHAHIILAGTEPKYVLAELMGRATGCSQGKGGSMHLFDVTNKFYGGHGIVGAQVPIGTGIALAEKYRNTNNVCYVFLGDGAVNQGQVFEAFNLAALWKLPVIYIIENNGYSMGTSVARSTYMTELYKKGDSFGIKGYRMDGMKLEEMYDVTSQATEFVRTGGGPIILEATTYRYRGHSMSDPAKYRTKEEVDDYKQRDPLVIARDAIIANNYIGEKELKGIEQEIKDTVKEAVSFAENSSLPNAQELYTNIYCA